MSDAVHSQGAPKSDGCLHLVLRPQAALLENCLAFCAENDTVVLMDAAVMLIGGVTPLLEFPVELCCLEADVRARGLEMLVPAAPWIVISDHGLVDRVVRHKHCLSWK